MSTPRYVSLIGLGFGDCGKGVFTDALCRRWGAHTVVRFNGGAQAGHNVVLPDGRHHTFSQFGSGTLVPGVFTVLAHPVVVHPGALLVEEARLRTLGVHDARSRLLIDGRCRVNTPFHQAAGRLRELLRGAHAHGTCGVGVGETVRHGLEFPEHMLRYADLARPALAMQKLEQIRCDLLSAFATQDPGKAAPRHAQSEWDVLQDRSVSEHWLMSLTSLVRQIPPATEDQIGVRLNLPGTVMFEGAQGVLLDEWKGFHPHTTWSSIHPRAVNAVARCYGVTSQIEHLGILRSYLTRHGAGPFPSEDSSLSVLAEPHNSDASWQGRFRRGGPDGVLLRYALEVTGPLDGLLVSHLDVFNTGARLKWCNAYRISGNFSATNEPFDCRQGQTIDRLPVSNENDLLYQAQLTEMLSAASPVYEKTSLDSPESLLEMLAHVAACPVLFGASGSTYQAIAPSSNRS